MVLNILKADLNINGWIPGEKPKSFTQIQRDLENRGLIKAMTPQAFHKMASKLLSYSSNPGPYFNEKALPPPPKKTPPDWKTVQELLEKWNTLSKNNFQEMKKEFFKNSIKISHSSKKIQPL